MERQKRFGEVKKGTDQTKIVLGKRREGIAGDKKTGEAGLLGSPIAKENRKDQKLISIWKESKKVIVYMEAFRVQIGEKREEKIRMRKNKVEDRPLDRQEDKVIWKGVTIIV